MSFENGIITMEGIPPPPVLWATAMVDTVCDVLQCSNWRRTLDIPESSWFAFKVPPMSPYYSDLLTYKEYTQKNSEFPPYSTESILRFAFQTPSTALGDLTTPTALMVLVILILIIRLIKAIVMPLFSRIAKWAAHKTHGPEWAKHNPERIYKFGEYVFRLFYHSFISIYGVIYFRDKSWWASGGTITLYDGYPFHPIEPGMAWYYLIQGAYNLDAMISLMEISFRIEFQNPLATGKLRSPVKVVWSETVRGDFREMFIHHIVTNLLVIGSSFFRLTRIGSMVFLVHDLSDVPVDLSKLANFVKWKYTTLFCFISMVVVWACTRLYILPVTIYGSILTQSHYVCARGIPVAFYVMYRHLFYVLVGLLILLHLAWFLMFVRMFATFVKKDELHDLSEHKNGEDNSHKKRV